MKSVFEKERAAEGGIRTQDPLHIGRVLYQLSYLDSLAGKCVLVRISLLFPSTM